MGQDVLRNGRCLEVSVVEECYVADKELQVKVGVVAGFGDSVAGRRLMQLACMRVCLDSTWRGAGLGTR